MSENIDLENISRSLNQIISSLNDLVSKQNAGLVSTEVPKIKKTSDMTYQTFLTKVLSSKSPVQITKKNQSYRLQEDLQLLLQLSNYSSITNKSYEQIVSKKRILRSAESLRARYSQHLQKIGQTEMKKIIQWVQTEGVQGYLYFEDKDIRFSLHDPKQQKKLDQKKDLKRPRNVSLDTSQKKFQKKRQGVLKKAIPTNCKQLNDILKIYSKMVNLPIKSLLQKLDQVSGDFVQLDNYIETKDSKILWSAEEDEVLRKGGAQLQLLKRYRGATIQQRKAYLGIN